MDAGFETERLIWRPFAPTDLDALYYLHGQPELMRYIIGRTRSDKETQDNLNAHMALRERYGFGLGMIFWRATDEVIGRGGLLPVVHGGVVEGEIIYMFEQRHWGRGLATEFASVLLRIGRDQLHLPRLFAKARPANVGSVRVMQKIGLTFVSETVDDVEYAWQC
jgi:ribosomal-protein-alanine N-acetyltransferase